MTQKLNNTLIFIILFEMKNAKVGIEKSLKYIMLVLTFIVFIIVSLDTHIKTVFVCCDDGTVNFTALPNALLERLQLPSLFVSKFLASLIVIMICCVPFAIYGKFLITILVFEISMMFCTVIGWLDGWVMLVNVFIVAGLFTFGFLSKMYGNG